MAQQPDGSDMTPEQARTYMTDFARTIGVRDHQIGSSIEWLDGGAKDPAALATDEMEIERQIARQDAAQYEKMMREKPP